MKQRLKKTQLYSVIIRLKNMIQRFQFAKCKPYRHEYGGISTSFLTNTPSANGWFYPRYANGKQHEPLATMKFIEAASSARTIADIGANLGWFTCIAANHSPAAQVYSFEMDRLNIALCADNISLNSLNNVTLEQCAVTNFNGMLNYCKSRYDVASPAHRLSQTGSIRCEVRAISLDSYFSDRSEPELIKIDVEGAEQLVLEGMTRILQGNVLHTILIEIHPTWLREMGGSVATICKRLQDSNFSLFAFNHRERDGEEIAVNENQIENMKTGASMFIARRL